MYNNIIYTCKYYIYHYYINLYMNKQKCFKIERVCWDIYQTEKAQ